MIINTNSLVQYSDHHLNTGHLKTGRGQVKVCFSDVFTIQMLLIQIPTVIIVKYVVLNVTFFRLDFEEEEEEEELFEDADDESAYFDGSFQEQQHLQHNQQQGSDEEDIIFYQEAEQV